MRFRAFLSSLIPDRIYLKREYYRRLHEKLNLKNPKTFNEKLQWLKIHDRKPIYTTMVDKFEAKKYVADRIGDKYIIPTLGVWDKFEDIDFDSLPNQFVLKTTHDSGGVALCKNKETFDYEKARVKLSNSLSYNYFFGTREWPYKNVKPRIIAEKYMEDSQSKELCDYKLMCFNGKVKCTFVCSERSKNLKVTFFDNDWNRMPFERHYPSSKSIIKRPQNFDTMIKLAEILSNGILFVRVDFYEINGTVYFGEMTFFPGSGFEEFSPEKWDRILGDWIDLPQ